MVAEQLLEQIFSYMDRLMVENDFDSMISIMTELGKSLAGSERASFWYWDEKRKEYYTIAAWGRGKITIPQGTGIVGATIQNKEAIVINDPYTDARFNSNVDKESGFVTKSILCVPVTEENGKVIGAFEAINKRNANGENCDFEQSDVKRLAMVTVFCGKLLESHLLKQQAQIDPLTGLKNRRGLYDFYARNVQSEKRPVSVIICDIDFFKKVNDTYGHNAGDAVLIHIADRLQASVAACDEVVRWGGEEFVFLLRNQDGKVAADFAEMIRKKIEATVCQYKDMNIQVTMSFGVEEFDVERSLDENIKRADEKLYRAKEEGRNRVIY